jgi:hypothetical protein
MNLLCSCYVPITYGLDGGSMKMSSFIKEFAAFGLFALGTYAWLVVA